MKRKFWVIYAGVLLVSTLVRHGLAGAAHPADGQQVINLSAVGGAPGQTVQVAYRDLRPPGKPDAPVLVLLHGSPVASVALNRLVDALQNDFRLIVPDLPGMGRSQWNVPDYSVAAHARAVEEMMTRLGVARAHVAGYSMGGGVAISLAGLAPERVASLTLISGLGVQEHELFGDHALNHAVHGAQLAALWALDNLTPHFGLLDWFPLNVSYARNFYDTDQRPLRGILAGWNGPMLIVHGREDGMVPPVAAREHARLVPQIELVWLSGGHGMVFGEQAAEIAARLATFVNDAEAGRTPVRGQATVERVRASQPTADPSDGMPWSGERRAVMLGLLLVATLASEDLACIAAGLLVAGGKLTLGPAVAACFSGIFVGDLLLVLAGRWLGAGVLNRWPLRGRVSAEALARAERWFSQRGVWVILASRFMPGTRLPTYLAAGVLRVPWGKFIRWFALACALWTPLLVGGAMLAGEAALGWFKAWSNFTGWLALTGAAVWLLARIAVPAATWRGRRLLLGKWRRITRWEFWPMWAVYPPVVAYCVWLALKHRGATVFTAANPGIGAGGGLVGESKSEILTALAGAGDAVAAWVLVDAGTDPEERWAVVRRFAATHGWPVVLKPDVGERGAGVVIARDESAARRALAEEPRALIAQRYVPGVEYGVFYVRMPGAERGEIFAVTDKRMLHVRGDGRRTLEELILADERAVCMGRFFLEKFTARLDEVPAAGAEIKLTELGTHCRGALFLDGAELITPELTAAAERVSRTFGGFYFGRYDVRTESAEAFRRGEFTVIELNGLTSEATSIYDPRHSVWFGWRVLCRQWALAFAIGAENRARGVRPLTVREIWALLNGGDAR